MVKGRQQNGKSGIVVVVVVVLEEDCEEDEEACSFQAQFNFSILRVSSVLVGASTTWLGWW